MLSTPLGCVTCNSPAGEELRAALVESATIATIGSMIGLVVALALAAALAGRALDPARGRGAPSLGPGAVLLGMGLGGFFDGILFHQILQVHGMLTAVRPRSDLVASGVNMFWDGLFHAATWTLTLVGLALAWRAVKAGAATLTPMLIGGALCGWGIFNGLEGLANHYVVGLHHVVETRGLSAFDHAFVVSGPLLVVAGALLARRAR